MHIGSGGRLFRKHPALMRQNGSVVLKSQRSSNSCLYRNLRPQLAQKLHRQLPPGGYISIDRGYTGQCKLGGQRFLIS